MFLSEKDVLQAVKSNKLTSPVTKVSPCDLMVLEGLVDGGYIKAVKFVPLEDGKPQFFEPVLTLIGEQRLEQLNVSNNTTWSIDRRLVALGIVVALVGLLVSLIK
jgi:hypothetical protein